MTEEDNACPEAENTAKDTSYKAAKDKKEKSRPFTKIVCRRLPPTMSEESFLEQVSPIPEHDYFYFSKPDLSLTPDLFSRAYINFVNVNDIFIFRDKFDDYIFLDEKGNEFPAIVEYAPFQRIPKKRRKKDLKSGTLESDPTYLEFLESLKETDSDCREPKMEYSFQLTEEKKETSTPLLEFLASRRKEEKRRKEERQRRRVRNRNSKEDDIIEEDIKKIKPRDTDKVKENAKSVNKKKDEDANTKVEAVDFRDKQPVKSGRTSKDVKKNSENPRRKGDSDKREYKNKLGDNGEVKLNRKERRERQREAAASKLTEKGKEVKKYSQLRKDKVDGKSGTSSFRQVDEGEQDGILSLTIESKTVQKTTESCVATENDSPKSKVSLLSSNIKPFTQLPQYKTEDLTKVIEEMDKVVAKLKVENEPTTSQEETVTEKSQESHESLKVLSDKNISPEDPLVQHQRRSSLESGDIKPHPEESLLRRHKSLDDKSQDDCSEREDTDKDRSSENKKEHRVRNKDRPSIVIYQPGMGKFSKQRIDRNKESTAGTYKPLDPTP